MNYSNLKLNKKNMKKTEYFWSHSGADNSFGYLVVMIKKIIQNNITSKFNYLDIGCGNGFLTKKISVNFRYTIGIDISKSAIKQAKKKYLGDIKFFNTDIKNFKSKKKFNFISLIEVIEHLYSPDNILKQIIKLMNKDTILIISTPYHGYLKNFLISLFNKFDEHVNPLWEHGHIKFWSINTLSKLCKKNRLKIIDIKFAGRFYPISKSMIFIVKKL